MRKCNYYLMSSATISAQQIAIEMYFRELESMTCHCFTISAMKRTDKERSRDMSIRSQLTICVSDTEP